MKHVFTILAFFSLCLLAVPQSKADCTSPAWVSTTAYAVGANVTYNSFSWQAVLANTGSVPQAGATSSWQVNNYCGTAPGPATGRTFAPYVDTLLSPTFQLTNNMNNVSPYYTLGFIVDSGGCTASWGGSIALSQNWMLSDINTLRSKGGDVTISFGGAAGNELAQDCSSVSALQTQYQDVIGLYQLKHMDFDIEGTDVTDTAATSLRDQALHNLQQANPGLTVSLTLPIEPYGLPAAELAVVQDAIAKGVAIDHVNVMAMDYGTSHDFGGAMGTDAMWSGWSTMYQLQGLYPSLTHAQIAGMMGITPMIGVNNTKSEIFSLSDAQYLEPEALEQGVGLLSFWSANRDQACARLGAVKPSCSGVAQTQWEFSGIFKPFN